MKHKQKINEYLQITFGVFIVAISFYYFLAPQKLVTGGVTGLSVLFQQIFEVSNITLSIFIYGANALLLLIGFIFLGKEFVYKTIYGSIILPTFTLIFSLIPLEADFVLKEITNGANQFIIVSVIGGTLTGLGLGLVFKNNATTGGSDVVIRILHEKLKVPNSVALYIVDGIIVGLSLFVIGPEPTFFAVVAIFITGLVVDRTILSGRSGYTVFIVTKHSETLKEVIYKKLDRGVTIINVMGGYSASNKEMLVCTISKNQLYHIKGIIADYEPNAFTFITKTSESVGLGFKW